MLEKKTGREQEQPVGSSGQGSTQRKLSEEGTQSLEGERIQDRTPYRQRRRKGKRNKGVTGIFHK